MSAVPWTPAQSIAWLRSERANPSQDWTDLCLHLATMAAGYAGGLPTASAFGRSIPKRLKTPGDGPRGSIQVWETSGWGHVAFSVGRGMVLCNDQAGGVSRIRSSWYSGLGGHYWVPSTPEVWHSATGRNPDQPPTPFPLPAPGLSWPLIPGRSDPRIPALKRALRWGNDNDRYGPSLFHRIVRFEKNHPAFGRPNGRIGPAEYAALVAR